MQVRFQNNYSSPLSVAVMWWDPDGCGDDGNWGTRGWWNLDPGQSVGTNVWTANRYFYLWAIHFAARCARLPVGDHSKLRAARQGWSSGFSARVPGLERGPLTPAGLTALGTRGCHHLPVGNRSGARGVLQETVEQQAPSAGVTAVEAEAELFEVGLQVLGLNPALMGAHQATLAQGRHPVHRRQQLVRLVPRPRHRVRLVGEPVLARLGISRPAVGHHGRAGLDGGAVWA